MSVTTVPISTTITRWMEILMGLVMHVTGTLVEVDAVSLNVKTLVEDAVARRLGKTLSKQLTS